MSEDKYWRVVSTAGFVVLSVGFALLAWVNWELRPVTVVKANKIPMPVTTPSVMAGAPIEYVFDYCKYIDANSTVSKELLDLNSDTVINLPVSGSSLDVGCHRTSILEPIPIYVPPGRYKMRTTRLYRISTYRDVPYVFETEGFDVMRANTITVPITAQPTEAPPK